MTENKHSITSNRSLATSSKQKVVYNIIAHQPNKTKTLRRDIVKDPKHIINQDNHLKIKSTIKSPLINKIKQPPYISSVDINKAYRASKIPRIPSINKFNLTNTSNKFNIATSNVDLPKQQNNQTTRPSLNKPTNLSIFEKAIQQATSHQQTFQLPQKNKNHLSLKYKLLMTATILFIAIAGFLTYQNIPNTTSFLNSQVTNFITKMPSYQIPGFYNAITTKQPGLYSATFLSHTDKRKYKLVESPHSPATNNQLLSYLTTAFHDNYQSITINGTTVYLFNNDATWIKNGIWYKLLSYNNAVSLNQILKIVSSS